MTLWDSGGADEVYATIRQPCCGVHKTASVLNALPQSSAHEHHGRTARKLETPTRADADRAIDAFVHTDGATYPQATEKLTMDRNGLLACSDFPAEHWIRVGTTNPIESTFATERHH